MQVTNTVAPILPTTFTTSRAMADANMDIDMDIDLVLDTDADPEIARLQAEAAAFDAVRAGRTRRCAKQLTHSSSRLAEWRRRS